MVKSGLRFDAKLCAWLGVLACVAGGTVAGAQEPPAVEAPAEAAQGPDASGSACNSSRPCLSHSSSVLAPMPAARAAISSFAPALIALQMVFWTAGVSSLGWWNSGSGLSAAMW